VGDCPVAVDSELRNGTWPMIPDPVKDTSCDELGVGIAVDVVASDASDYRA